MSTPTSVVTLRAPTHADVPAIAAMMNARGLALHGEPDMSERELRGWFALPSIDLERDVRIALDVHGVVVGYVDLGGQGEDGLALWIDLRVLPGPEGEAAIAPLLDAVEARAGEKGAAGAVLIAVVEADDEPYREELAHRGYEAARSSFIMAIAFEGAPQAARFPPDVVVRPLRGGEERSAYEAVNASFAGGWNFTPQPYAEFVHWLGMGDVDPELRFVAIAGGEVVGICLCRPAARGDGTRGWVDQLGVIPAWRGRGLGRALLLHALEAFARRGLVGGALSVDAENVTGAVRLYESVGMHVTRRFDKYQRAVGA